MSSNVNYNSWYVSGFYHDLQKKNRLLSVTLHPSTITSDGGESWSKVTDGIGTGNVKYRKEPLATAILKEDFTVAIANSWADFQGGDQISQLFNSVKPFAAYAKYASEHLDIMSKKGHEAEKTLDGVAVKWINKAVDFVRPYLDKGVDYLNRALVVQGSRFSYYAGTGTSFGNLAMKFTIFADWKDGTFKTVHEQLAEIYPYIMGKYIDWDDSDKSNSLNEFLGWQTPPGGYKADVRDVDTFVEGTLLINFGGYYSIPNIVIKDAQLTFSKQMVKNPLLPFRISPLSCDVQLTLQAATKFSDRMLSNFVNGNYTTEDVTEIEKMLEENLRMVKNENGKLLGNSSTELSLYGTSELSGVGVSSVDYNIPNSIPSISITK